MTRRPSPLLLSAPLVIALLVASWLLWARQEPSRQGGYCANATIEVTRVVSASVDLGAGATPPVQQILERVDEVDVRRFQVATPAAIAPDVELLADEGSPDAFARILVDYLERCGEPT